MMGDLLNRLMGDLLNRLKNLIKSGVGQSFDDSGDMQIGESNWLGRTKQTVESIVPYGTFGTPMAKVRQILFSMRGNESNVAALNSDSVNRIIKNTKPGEYGIGSPSKGSYIYFKDDGKIESKTDKMTVVLDPTGKITITGASDELMTVIDDWMTEMGKATVITGIGPQPFTPVTITNLGLIQARFNTLKG